MKTNEQSSKGHLGFTTDISGQQMEVFHSSIGADWRNVVWSSTSNALDVISGFRCGGRPAPFDVVKTFATDFPWK